MEARLAILVSEALTRPCMRSRSDNPTVKPLPAASGYARKRNPAEGRNRDLRAQRLVTGIVAIGLFAIKAERFNHRQVIEREQARIFAARRVGMLVPCPGGDTEDVP